MARYVRYSHRGIIAHGELRGETIHPLDGGFDGFRPADKHPVALADVKLLAPAMPTKIVAIGPGYGSLPPGMSQPMLWIKPPSCVNDPDGIVEIPPSLAPINIETELAFVIGRTAKMVGVVEAQNCIFGYTCLNDLTSGDLSSATSFVSSHYFVDGKIFDGFAPMGPWIETDIDPDNLAFECRINGEVRQSGSTATRIYRDAELVSMISQILTLHPGDVVTTGSPPGIQQAVAGDIVEIAFEGIGTLRSHFVARGT